MDAKKINQMVDQYKGNLTLYECAGLLGIDVSYVWKALRLADGKSYSDIVEAYKLGEAERLLLHTELKVNEISAGLGYANPQNFIRFFNRRMGITPGRYRQLQGRQ